MEAIKGPHLKFVSDQESKYSRPSTGLRAQEQWRKMLFTFTCCRRKLKKAQSFSGGFRDTFRIKCNLLSLVCSLCVRLARLKLRLHFCCIYVEALIQFNIRTRQQSGSSKTSHFIRNDKDPKNLSPLSLRAFSSSLRTFSRIRRQIFPKYILTVSTQSQKGSSNKINIK